MNFSNSLYLVVRRAENCSLKANDLQCLDACEVVKQFLKYLPDTFASDATPNMQKLGEYTDFCDDEDKMKDFNELSKDEFLSSYSYLTEEEYNLTRIKERDHGRH